MRVGFLLNHDQIHQVAHSVPIAVALARASPGIDVVVATTTAALAAETDRLIAEAGGAPLRRVELRLRGRLIRAVAPSIDTLVPAVKLGMYRDNLDFFSSLDALVVAEKTSAILKTRYGLDRLRLIHTRHGAGDRAIGFDRASALFDHVLVSGPKIRRRLIAEAGVPAEHISIVGYPKFDLAPGEPHLRFTGNGRPTVVYNPHPSPHLSSWYTQGRAVLDYFLHSDRYNLIFAPHVMLFHRRLVLTIDRLRLDRPGRVAPEIYRAPNIHVDLGSRASTDMSYTSAADLYLGDVSSQIYEFLREPRPALFLNPFAVPWAGNPDYAHWQAGEVIEEVRDLGAALDRAFVDRSRFAEVQRRLFADSFDLTDEPSSHRAARAIRAVLAI
ncbi:MAG: hypothetical protein ACRYG4_23480 [Janthinobacterium lividum]